MTPQQRHVAEISLEDDIKDIPEQRDGADGGVDGDIPGHSGKKVGRGSEPPRLQDQVTGEREPDQIAGPGDKAENGIGSKSEAGPGNREGGVERAGEAVQAPLQPVQLGVGQALDLKQSCIGRHGLRRFLE